MEQNGGFGIITTREKIGTTAKRFILFFYNNKTKIHKIQNVIYQASKLIPDIKKIIDIIFILQGLGIITRISQNKFIFTGLRGMINQINEIILKRVRKHQQTLTQSEIEKQQKIQNLFSEDIYYENRYISIKSSVFLGQFIRDIFGHLVLTQNRAISKVTIEQCLEPYITSMKDAFQKSIVNDTISIFSQLTIADKNESGDHLHFSGPECLNQRKITYEQIHKLHEEQIVAELVNVERNEQLFFCNLIKDMEDNKEKRKNIVLTLAQMKKEELVISIPIKNGNNNNNQLASNINSQNNIQVKTEEKKEQQFQLSKNNNNSSNNNQQQQNKPQFQNGYLSNMIPSNLSYHKQYNMDVSQVPHSHVSQFTKSAFALLKGKSWQYHIQKFQVIIGKNSSNSVNVDNGKGHKMNKNYNWITDLEIQNGKRISRQHAVILYNFDLERFEIKCLSKKFIMKVNHQLYSHHDQAIPLKNRYLITLGNENFYFFLPKNPKNAQENLLQLNNRIENSDRNINNITQKDTKINSEKQKMDQSQIKIEEQDPQNNNKNDSKEQQKNNNDENNSKIEYQEEDQDQENNDGEDYNDDDDDDDDDGENQTNNQDDDEDNDEVSQQMYSSQIQQQQSSQQNDQEQDENDEEEDDDDDDDDDDNNQQMEDEDDNNVSQNNNYTTNLTQTEDN